MLWKSHRSQYKKTWFVDHPMGELPYDLGDIPSDDGQSYHSQIADMVYQTSISISEELQRTEIFSNVSNFIPIDKLRLYLEFAIGSEIYPLFIAKYIADWHQKRAPQEKHSICWKNHKGLGKLVKEYWDNDWPDLVLGSKHNIYALIKEKIKPIYNKLLYIHHHIIDFLGKSHKKGSSIPEGPNILIKYTVGINMIGRSDLFWINSDNFSECNHIVYFDEPINERNSTEELLGVLNYNNVWFINLYRQYFRDPSCYTIPRPYRKGRLTKKFESCKFSPATDAEKWLINSFSELINDVDYWELVYDRLNVKIHVDISEGSSIHIAQNIALDIRDGIRLAWQRSELLPNYGALIGWNPSHIFLAWNARADLPLTQNRSRVSSIIITGLYDDTLLAQRLKKVSSSKSIQNLNGLFKIALFDNMFFREDLFSKSMIVALYTEFLQWVIVDDSIAVLNKPKRSLILKLLPELNDLMEQAESTGRWINLIDQNPHLTAINCLPIDAFCKSDISVGIGISSAVTEAVAYGIKGIHCDLPYLKDHPFYEWGYNQIVFSDLKVMINELKDYQNSDQSQNLLGNFQDHIDQIDPFRDGKQPERVAIYLYWLVDGFRNGLSRTQVISLANDKYGKLYGYDKVIEKTST